MAVGEVGKILLPTNALWQAAEYHLEPPALIALARGFTSFSGGNPFMVLAPQPAAVLIWAAIWAAIVFGIGALSLGRRQI